MFVRFFSVLMVLVLVNGAALADPVVVDFNDAELGELLPFSDLRGDYFEDGFRMTNVTNHYDFFDLGGVGGTFLQIDTHSGGPGGVSSVRFDRLGETFDLLSVEILAWILGFEPAFAFITSSAGGLSVIAEETNPVVASFSGPDWTDVSWIDFSILDSDLQSVNEDTLQIDNIVFYVPEPSTLLLLCTGLVGLVAMKKRAS